MAKEGSVVSGLMDSFATSVSIMLQYGVPLKVLINKFSHQRFEPSGFTSNKDIPIAKSVMDYIFRWLDLKFGDKAGDADGTEPDGAADASEVAVIKDAQSLVKRKLKALAAEDGGPGRITMEEEREVYKFQSDSPPCPECGSVTVRNGACYKCNNCGATTGCS
jgi:ribonucleoside-diphosphate reductase alpha chain